MVEHVFAPGQQFVVGDGEGLDGEKGSGVFITFALDDRANALSLQAQVAWRC